MKNMYMTPLSYKDFAGNKRTTKLHFHLTPREFADWMVENRAVARQLEKDFNEMREVVVENPEEEASEDTKMAMLRLIRILAEISYGVPESNEVFDKSDGNKFKYSAAYDNFRVFLFSNMRELNQFVTTILNEENIAEFTKVIGAEAEDTEPAQLSSVPAKKDPRDMSHEELLAAFQEKSKQ